MFQYKTTPFNHQREALEATANKVAHAFFWEMGTGKSKVVIDSLAFWHESLRINSAIILAPLSVLGNWRNEFETHMSGEYVIHIWSGMKTKWEKKAYTKFLRTKTDKLKVLVINYDTLPVKRAQVAINELVLAARPFALIADESTYVKNHNAARTKLVCKVAELAVYRRILTGTPIAQSPLDLFGQAQVLGDVLPQRNYYAFKGKYAREKEINLGNRKIKKIVGYRNLKDLNKLMNQIGHVLTKEECLDLPEKLYTKVSCQMTPDQWKAYNELKQLAITELDGHTITGTNALSIMVKLQQITCGQIKTGENKYHLLPDCPRIQQLVELVSEAAGKVVVWSPYRGTQKMIAEALDPLYGVANVHADMGARARSEAIDEFRFNPNVKVFNSNPATAGHGVTLVEAHTVIYYGNSFSLEKRLQSEDRVHRAGQRNACLYIDLSVPGTVDDYILKTLREKKDLSEMITQKPELLRDAI